MARLAPQLTAAAGPPGLDLRLLGPLEVVREGRALDLGAHKQQALLGVLALHAREVVSSGRLIEELWGERPPASAPKAVQGYVSGLRKALGATAIVTRAGGYLVAPAPGALDVERFDGLVATGRERLAGDPLEAAQVLRAALALWRGEPLEGLRFEAHARVELQRLEERRLVALELRIEADLALGRHAELVGELHELVVVHPYREGLAAHLMLALYRAGRQVEALAAYRRTRVLLTSELGLEPSEALRRLERQVLAQDRALEPADGAPTAPADAPPGPAQHARRLVTVLAARAESGDAEALHAALERAGEVVERHGGTVERYLGDAVLGLFGLTRSREDDSLRAVRAGLELQGPGIGPLRVGIESGETFVGPRTGGATFATGAAITTAGRLAEAAPLGEVLLGERVRLSLTADVRCEAGTGRLLELRTQRPGLMRVSRTPLVGRERELETLRTALAQASATPACHMVTVLGAAGLGKSRLAAELLATAGDDASVLVGRCRADADGATFRVLAELVAQPGIDVRERVEELLADNEPAARRVLGAIGESDEPAQAQEAFWAMRTLLERLARERPLIVAIEDIHWAEPLLLDLLDHVLAFARDSPILLLCMARPDLLEVRPSWTAPQPDRSVIVLDPLGEREATALVQRLGATARIAPIVRRAEGNPLFLEQLVAVGAEGADTLPASIQALFAARIDRLEPHEAGVLRHAAVEGPTFHAGAVAALLPADERPAVDSRLVALARKGLIRPDRAEFAQQAAFRFDHALIRDAAYESIPKRARADLHARIADWIEERAPGSSDEIVGRHLELACLLPAELGTTGERERVLAARAAEHLRLAARGARGRGDTSAAARLLERAAALLGRDDPGRAALLPALGAALFDAGRQGDATRVLTEAVQRTRDPRLAARAQVEHHFVLLQGGDSAGTAHARAAADRALPVLERHGDEFGQSRAWSLRAMVAWFECRAARADDAWRQAAELARLAHEERELFEVLCWRTSAAAFGPSPVPEAIGRCEEIRETVRSSPFAAALTLHPLALLHAMSGDLAHARALAREANATLRELGGVHAAVSHHEAVIEMLGGRPARAEELLRDGYVRLSAMGDGTLLATTAAMLAQAVYAQGRADEAQELCDVSRRGAPADDILTQVIWQGVQAQILAARGSAGEAERLARATVASIARTDWLTHHGDALLDLAEVLRLAGRPQDAYHAAQDALSLYAQKGNATACGRVRSRFTTTTQGDQ